MDYKTVGDVAEIMLHYVEQGRTYQSDKITRVPVSSYTDPTRWQREMDLIFKRLPLLLALSAELPESGSYKAMEAAGLPVLVTRDKTGTARAFLNVCAHRGAPLAPEGHGHCSRFTCRYHAWTYSNDGRLLAVTDKEKFGEFDRSKRGLTELPCREKAGMIFGVLRPGATMDVDAYFGNILDDFEGVDFAHWTYLGSRVIEGANWKVAYDGYLEGYHFATLHPTTIAPRTYTNITHYESFGPHLRIGFPQVNIGALRKVPREEWGRHENAGFDFVRTLFPNVSVFLAPEIAQIAQLFPGPTPDRNRTVLTYVRRKPVTDGADQEAVEKMINWLRDVTYGEDYVLGLKIQKGLESGALQDVIFGKNERGNQFFHEVVDWYLAEDPSKPMPVL